MDVAGRLRERAGATRRAADRLTLLRLRLARTGAEVTALADAGGPTVLAEDRIAALDAALSRAARSLRSAASALEEAATRRERTSGRRLGGYGGAGFLGRGDAAHGHVGEVARFTGAALGARLGGVPLAPPVGAPAPVHPSDLLGEPTPAPPRGAATPLEDTLP